MQTVTARRTIDAPADAIRAAMADTEAFMRAGGFDEVTVEGDEIHLGNNVGLLTIELDLVATEEPGSDFVYEQEAGVFESMVTRFTIEEGTNGSRADGSEAEDGEADGTGPDGTGADESEADGGEAEGDGEGEADGDGVTVVGETDFALDASLVGPILDATIIKRQRRKELNGHFDFLEERVSHGNPNSDPDGQAEPTDA